MGPAGVCPIRHTRVHGAWRRAAKGGVTLLCHKQRIGPRTERPRGRTHATERVALPLKSAVARRSERKRSDFDALEKGGDRRG
jgi:hypothetical protein